VHGLGAFSKGIEVKISPFLTLIKPTPELRSEEQQDEAATHLLQCWTRAKERLALVRLADRIGNTSGDDGAA